jgi:hypothetical protein
LSVQDASAPSRRPRWAVWDRHPGIGRGLVEAFQKADEMFNAVQLLYPYSSPWLIDDVEQTEQLIGRKGYAPSLETTDTWSTPSVRALTAMA